MIPTSQEGRVAIDSILFGSQYLPANQGGNSSQQNYLNSGLFNNYQGIPYSSLNESIMRLIQNVNNGFNNPSSSSGSTQGRAANTGGTSSLSSSQSSALLGVASSFAPINQKQADALQGVISSFSGGE